MNELGWILVGIIIGIPISYFVNLTTPGLESYLKNRSLSRRERKIKSIISAYRVYKGYKEDPSSFQLVILSLLTWAIAVLGFMVMTFSIQNISLFRSIGLVCSVVLCFLATRLATAVDHVRNFDAFREQAIKKLVKQGGNPEDLDKEEKIRDVEKPVAVEKKTRKTKTVG